MTSPIGISWGCDDLDLEGGYGPLVLDDYPNSLTTAEESLCSMFADDNLDPDDILPARIHAARDDDGSIDIFGKDGPSLWQRIKAWWGDLTGPVPGDGGASVSGRFYPWGLL